MPASTRPARWNGAARLLHLLFALPLSSYVGRTLYTEDNKKVNSLFLLDTFPTIRYDNLPSLNNVWLEEEPNMHAL